MNCSIVMIQNIINVTHRLRDRRLYFNRFIIKAGIYVTGERQVRESGGTAEEGSDDWIGYELTP